MPPALQNVLVFATCWSTLVAAARTEDNVRVHAMSFNIRTSQASTDVGGRCSDWNLRRKTNVVTHIKSVGADFVGTQETSDAQKVYLDAALEKLYAVIGKTTGSLNGNAAEWNALYYRRDKWKLVTDGMFWLGPNPNVMSAGWGMAYYRTCVWGRFQHLGTGATICVLNTHYETPGNDEAQDRLIVVLGDFNALKSYSAMQLLYDHDLKDPSNDGTFCGDTLSPTCNVKYDFTLYRTQSKHACYIESEISRINYDGCYSSDHAAIIGSFCFHGSCCANETVLGSTYAATKRMPDVASESDVVSKVRTKDVLSSTPASKTPTTVPTPDPTPPKKDPDPSSADLHQTISTKSGDGSNVSLTVGSIFGALSVCVLLALFILRRKKKMAERAFFDKSYDPETSGYYGGPGAARAVSDMSAMSPLREDDDRVSQIPELAAVSHITGISTSSSVSVDFARPEDCTSHELSSAQASTAGYVITPASSRGPESPIRVNYSEIFTSDSCVSEDAMGTTVQLDRAKL